MKFRNWEKRAISEHNIPPPRYLDMGRVRKPQSMKDQAKKLALMDVEDTLSDYENGGAVEMVGIILFVFGFWAFMVAVCVL